MPRAFRVVQSGMRVDLFDFDLPKAAIAQTPVVPGHNAKLLNLTTDPFSDYHVWDLPILLKAGDLLLVIDTKVIPSRLMGRRGDVPIEVLLNKQETLDQWSGVARPARRLRQGDTIIFAKDFSATILAKQPDGQIFLRFFCCGKDFIKNLYRWGTTPLPPYIDRSGSVSARKNSIKDKVIEKQDRHVYQTIFANKEGAVAAPTAGLHFTKDLIVALRQKQIELESLTLHVGAGTFQSVWVEDTRDHKMTSEWGEIKPETAKKINTTRKKGGRIIAVGTTALRILESATNKAGHISPFTGETDIFITPGYEVKSIDGLLTNFHLPKSTLFMLVSALQGLERIKRAYAYAIKNNYRFYSFGDCCYMDVRQNRT